MPEFTGHNDLRSYLRILWRWKWLFLALLVAAPAVTYLLEHGKPSTYQSHALVGVSDYTVNAPGVGTSGQFEATNIEQVAALVTTPAIANLAGAHMKPPTPGGSIVGDISVSANTSTNFLTITATDQSPTRAADVANAFAQALNKHQANQAVGQIQSAIAGYTAELKGLSPKSATYASLHQQIAQLRGALTTQGGNAEILAHAAPNYTPVGPHLRRSIELGFVIGLLLAFAATMLAESADRRMHSPDDLEAMTDLPMLAAIAPSAFSGELDTGPVDEEAFQTLRTSLTYFTVDRKLKSVLITSPGEQEGKSTVAVRLALASARAGLSVILIDADLRRAGATAKLGLQPHVHLGLVLAEQRPAEPALIEWPLGGDAAGRLRVLTAGPPPPNPAALVSSQKMRNLIASLEQQADMVILDTPAGLAVSDAVPLMGTVSGVVLVARMDRSTRETIKRMQRIVESAHGHLLGAVATGVTSGPGYGKYSQAYYAPTGRDRPHRRRRVHKVRASEGPLSTERLRSIETAPLPAAGRAPEAESIASLKIVPQEQSADFDD